MRYIKLLLTLTLTLMCLDLCVQYDQLSEALTACGRDDIVNYIYDVKQKFEPGIHVADFPVKHLTCLRVYIARNSF